VKPGCNIASRLPWAQQYLLWAIRITAHTGADHADAAQRLARTFRGIGLTDALFPIRSMLLELNRSIRFPLVILDPSHGCVACGERCLLDFFSDAARGDGPTQRAWASILPADAFAACADCARRAARVFADARMPLDSAPGTPGSTRVEASERLH
jgi:hypothetical protein